MKKMFVGGLPLESTEETVTEMFNEYGKVRSIKLAADVFTGKCKGFGFIEMVKEPIADHAVKTIVFKTRVENLAYHEFHLARGEVFFIAGFQPSLFGESHHVGRGIGGGDLKSTFGLRHMR